MMLLSASSDLIRGRVANERSVQVCCTGIGVVKSNKWLIASESSSTINRNRGSFHLLYCACMHTI
jgi:hypothetical protein